MMCVLLSPDSIKIIIGSILTIITSIFLYKHQKINIQKTLTDIEKEIIFNYTYYIRISNDIDKKIEELSELQKILDVSPKNCYLDRNAELEEKLIKEMNLLSRERLNFLDSSIFYAEKLTELINNNFLFPHYIDRDFKLDYENILKQIYGDWSTLNSEHKDFFTPTNVKKFLFSQNID